MLICPMKCVPSFYGVGYGGKMVQSSIIASILFYFYLFIILYLFYLFILVVPGLSCGRWAPWLRLVGSLVAAGGLLSCDMWTLSCGVHVGSSSLTRDRTRIPCIGRQILNHWATREVPASILFSTDYMPSRVLKETESHVVKELASSNCHKQKEYLANAMILLFKVFQYFNCLDQMCYCLFLTVLGYSNAQQEMRRTQISLVIG